MTSSRGWFTGAPVRPARRKLPQTSPTAPLRVPVADGLRGLACLGVLFYHTYFVWAPSSLDHTPVGSIMLASYVNVDIFCVLSGFVLFLPVITRGGTIGSIRAFALRRAARLLPVYYLAIALTVALYPLFTRQPSLLRTRGGALNVGLHLTFLYHTVGLALGYREGFGVNGVVWSLGVEIVFYLLLPFIAGAYSRRPVVGLLVACGVTAAWRFATAHGEIPLPHLAAMLGMTPGQAYQFFLNSQFPNYAAQFALGMTAAWAFTRLRVMAVPTWLPSLAAPSALLVVLGGMVLTGSRTGRGYPLTHAAAPISIAVAATVLLLSLALAPPRVQWPLANRAARWVGDVSYGLYLFHVLVLTFIYAVLGWAPGGTWTLLGVLGLCVAASLAAGSLSHVFLERPVILWARTKSRGMTPRAPSPARRADIPPSPARV